MDLNQFGLFELIQERISVVRIECEIKGFPRRRIYPVEILVETEDFSEVRKTQFSVPRKHVTLTNFNHIGGVSTAEVYAIRLERDNPNSKYIVKVMSPLGEERYSSPFTPKKDKVHTFDLLKELFGAEFKKMLPFISSEN